MNDEENRKRVEEAIERANRIIATWPEWKKNILVQAGQATVSVPRTPIFKEDSQ